MSLDFPCGCCHQILTNATSSFLITNQCLPHHQSHPFSISVCLPSIPFHWGRSARHCWMGRWEDRCWWCHTTYIYQSQQGVRQCRPLTAPEQSWVGWRVVWLVQQLPLRPLPTRPRRLLCDSPSLPRSPAGFHTWSHPLPGLRQRPALLSAPRPTRILRRWHPNHWLCTLHWQWTSGTEVQGRGQCQVPSAVVEC